MSFKVSDIITIALRKAGAIRKSEVPAADETQDALDALKIMLHSWAARKLMVRATVPENFPITANVAAYTIGSGGAFNTTKPFSITSAYILDANGVKSGLDVVTKEKFESHTDNTIATARPVELFYDPGLAQQATQKGTINLYYIPDATIGYTLYINSTKPFTDFATLAEDVTFEPPYEEAIMYELAIRLWRDYHAHNVAVPRDLYDLANEAMHTVETMNAKQVVSGIDLPGTGSGAYNIYMGGNSD